MNMETDMETDLEAGRPLRILFVEDISTDAELAERALRKEGIAFTPARVETKDALLQALDEFRPDVVISDYALTAFSGMQALALTLAHNPDLPFILLTGAVSEETAVACMKAGATDYLLKERIARLPFAVKEALENRRARVAREEAERALRESELRYRTLADSGQALIWISGPDKNCNYVNQPWLAFTGRTLEQELGDGWTQGVHPDDLAGCLATYVQAFDRREPFSMDYRLRDRHGEFRWIQDDGAPRYDSQGNFLGYIGHSLDITEHKRVEKELREKTRLNQVLLDAFPCVALLEHSHTREIIASNAAGARVGAVPGTRCYATWGQRQDPCPWCLAPEVWATGEPRHLEVEALGIWWDAYWIPVAEDQYMHFAFDITRRKRAEEALRESEEQSRATFEQAAVGIAQVAPDGRYLRFNQRWCDITGYTREELLTKSFQDITHPDDLGNDVANLHRLLANEIQTYSREKRYIRKDGSSVWVNLTVSLLREPAGAPRYFVSVVEDITERKHAEETLRNREGMLQRIFDILPVGLWFADKDGKLLRGNPAGVKIWGAEPKVDPSAYGVFKGRRLPSGEEVAPDDWALVHTIRDRVTIVDELLEIDAFDGKKKTILNYSAPVLDAQGDVQGAIVVNQDITERKQAEEAERDQRQLAVALSETAAALNRTLDLDQVLDTILENAGRVVPHDAGDVLLLTADARVRAVRHRGYRERGLEEWARNRVFPLSDFPILARVADTRQPLVIPDTRDFPGWVDVPETRWIRSYICAPIVGKDRVTGFIRLSSASLNMYGLEHARRLSAFADQAAVALENASLFAQVGAGREQLRVLSRRLLEAQEVERRRVARELHDEVGQLLTGLKLVLQMTSAGASEGQKRGLGEAETLVGELMTRVRQLSLDLRPAMLDDLGLLPALLWHMPRYSQQTKVAVDFKHSGLDGRRFAPETETAAYRIVQEALTNVARHSGVTQATVRVWSDSETLAVQVDDLGAGFDADALLASGKTSGLAGMRERAVLLGGQLTVESAPGHGTHLSAVLPLAEPAGKRAAKR